MWRSPKERSHARFLISRCSPYLPRDRADGTHRLPLHRSAVSTWLSGPMLDLYGEPTSSRLPTSVDSEMFRSPPRGKQAVPSVGFVCSSSSFKGSDTAFAAVALARRRVPDLRFVSSAYPVGSTDHNL